MFVFILKKKTVITNVGNSCDRIQMAKINPENKSFAENILNTGNIIFIIL